MTDKADPVTLALFSNRFMGIAEAMGNALRHTSVSTNIKERLDFSCALFAADGSLISNAPHLPVHLGSMSFAVASQIERLGVGENAESGDGIVEGDVLLSNSPTAGGSHLPDITVITPVFDKGKIIFFTASRGHHADVGGISPGSMSPLATSLFQEGANIESFKIVRKGVYDSAGLRKRLIDEPASYPGSSGSRSYADVESDLRAQIAANHKGIQLINSLITEWGLETVQRYMKFITDNAELAVRNMLKRTVEKLGRSELHAVDYMDDGTPIELSIKIDAETGDAVFDFEGTGFESWSSLNAPMAVCYSMIIYSLRALCGEPIPLNSGCLKPLEVKIPHGTILRPSETCAVVGGNVTTSQRVADVILRAFEACAASQGCCNNLTFGTEDFGFYETVAGGSGAGPGWNGESGVHVAATNTRITDVEIMERRYPVLLREFSLRKGSGGDGQYQGGDGVVRDIEFTIPNVQVSILSERRVVAPYGMADGSEASKGTNTWVKQRRAEDRDLKEGAGPRRINLGPRNSVKFGKGDRFVLHTPGGGGYGSKVASQPVESKEKPSTSTFRGFMGSIAERAAAQLGV
ncbi:uncharacterized protein JCM6883_006068 [Sporobolomyces salmoneus]|uniref:uncharacterized protein n=1 Tax=Sporobolomyces salmoneus TaxID=183962 RepID=UPI00316B1DE2